MGIQNKKTEEKEKELSLIEIQKGSLIQQSLIVVKRTVQGGRNSGRKRYIISLKR